MRPVEIAYLGHKTIVLSGIVAVPGGAVVVVSSGGAVVVVGAAVLVCPPVGAVVAVGTAVLLCPSGGAVVVVDSLDDETPAAVVGDFTLEEAVEKLAAADASCSPLVIVVEATGGTGDCGGAEDIVADSDAVPVDGGACVMVETSIPCALGTLVVVVVAVVVGIGGFVVFVIVFSDTLTDAPIDPGFFWKPSNSPPFFFDSFTMSFLIASTKAAGFISFLPEPRALNCWTIMVKATSILPFLQKNVITNAMHAII